MMMPGTNLFALQEFARHSRSSPATSPCGRAKKIKKFSYNNGDADPCICTGIGTGTGRTGIKQKARKRCVIISW